ncbi:MAG: lipopolysaccharide heptosyltransferase I [Thermodesulfobacteriota bacterium]|nr:lipopolysaccharide heptosyltransferase I [Thermodesulfobacteriota bacterium]
MQSPDSILIVKLSAIGDVVHSLPFLEVLRRNFPCAQIDWLVEEGAAEIIEGHPAIDRVIVSRRRSWQRSLAKGKAYPEVFKEAARFLRKIRVCKYDLVIDLQGLLKSGVLTGISRGKRKIGMSGTREGGRLFLNERPVLVDYEQHAIDRYLKLAEYLECEPSRWKGDIPVFESDRRLIDRLLNGDELGQGHIVAINPVARWKTKLWESERFAALADRIGNDLSCDIIFTGSERDRDTVEDISRMMTKTSVNLAGRTNLKELACLYARCRALVSTDTGPMHIAAAAGCPVVALFGPTAPRRTGPYGYGHRVVSSDVECSPCFKRRCEHMTCMKSITVERAFEAVRSTVMENDKTKES